MKNYILIITIHADPAMPPGYGECGGTQTYMRELLDELSRLNISCILITRKSMHYLPNEEQYSPTCKIIRLINGSDEPISKLLLHQYHEKNLEYISQIIESQEGLPSVIHSVYWNSGRLAMELSRKYKIPFVHSVISNSRGRVSRGAYEPIPQRSEYEQEIYKQAQTILCVSEDEKNDLIKYYHISEDKLIACGQYVDNSFVTPSHDSNGYPQINSRIDNNLQEKIALTYNDALDYDSQETFWQYKAFTYFGRLDLNKGILQIAEAWYDCYKIYGQYCPPLWIAGGSIMDIEAIRREMSAIIPDLENLERCYKLVWWGYLNSQGLSTILLKTQVVIMHSLYEPGGRVVVEAMSEGIPIIATFNGFAKDFIRDWRNGFLVQHGDIMSLFGRMEHFIRQPFLSDTLGRQARSKAKNIIYHWGFLKNHLQAYNLHCDLSNDNYVAEPEENNYIDIVRIFPYAEHELADDYIKNTFSKFSSQEIILIQSEAPFSNNKLIQTKQDNYFMKQVTPKLLYEPLYNPFAKDLYVTDTKRAYNTETSIQLRIQSPIFIGSDPFHRLLFYRKTDTPDWGKTDSLKKCLNTILNFSHIALQNEKEIFLDLIDKMDISSQNSINKFFEQLDQKLPQFYFPRSGIFSLKLAWAIFRWILKYNEHILNPELYKRLNEICDFYCSKNYNLTFKSSEVIIPAITAKNFRIYKNEYILTGLQEVCLGTPLTETAVFLYNYIKQLRTPVLSFIQDIEILTRWENSEHNITDFWSTIAFCFCQDIIITAVVFRGETVKLLTELESIIGIENSGQK